jgi:hypothetical protein
VTTKPLTSLEIARAGLMHIARELEYAYGGQGQMPYLERHIYDSAQAALERTKERPSCPEAELAITQLQNSTRRIEAQLQRTQRENLVLALKETATVLGQSFRTGADPLPVRTALEHAAMVLAQEGGAA